MLAKAVRDLWDSHPEVAVDSINTVWYGVWSEVKFALYRHSIAHHL
jgi:hypothetical protein